MPSVIATLQALVVEHLATNAGQQATILDLHATNVRLEEPVRDLETRVGQHSGNSSRPSSSDLPQTPRAPEFVANQVTGLPVIHRRLTEYRLHLLACPSCGTRTWASLQT